MRRFEKVVSILSFLFIPNCVYLAYADSQWQRLDEGSMAIEATSIALDNHKPSIIYAGFRQSLYKINNDTKHWELLGSPILTDINFLLIDQEDTKIIYAATKNGLYRSQDQAQTWQRIFLGKDVSESDVLSVCICYQRPKSVFIATRGGIFFTPVNRIIWQKVGGRFADADIISLTQDLNNPDIFYVVSDKGLFKAHSRMSSSALIYNVFNREAEDKTEDIDSGEEEISSGEYSLKYLAIDPKNKGLFYLATQEGLVVSQDAGRNWQRRELSGLLNRKINYILVSPYEDRVFLATKDGVFDCSGDSCKHIYEGMDFKNVKQLALDSRNRLYAACDKGLYFVSLEKKTQASTNTPGGKKNLTNIKEPTILDIQREAIRYAEVYPEKISAWRRQARIKALFPEVTLDYDKTVTTALGASYDKVQVGPRDWGLSLKWDVSDLVFSSEQTSIDVRSRLMVQLREDLLNEVTRLYFERKRLQLELAKEEELEREGKTDKELRFQELSASIDGLTGGYLTRYLNDAKS